MRAFFNKIQQPFFKSSNFLTFILVGSCSKDPIIGCSTDCSHPPSPDVGSFLGGGFR